MSKENMDKKLVKKMYLTSHKKARKHLARLINEFNRNENANIPRYRTITFMFKALLEYFRFEKDLQIEQRLEALEKRMDMQ